MVRAKDVPDECDFYPARINDRPASVLVNLWYRGRAPVEGYPHLVWAFIRMPEPGDHGMGTGETMKALGPVEDRLADLMAKEDVHHPGRIRGEGSWQVYFYTRDAEATEKRIRKQLEGEGLEFGTGAKSDPQWTFFSDLLSPNEERMQWIQDSRLLDVLKNHGDPLTEPRPVEHWIYFKTPEERDAFVRSVVSRGFEIVSKSDDPAPDKRPYGLVIQRTDPVNLDAIHSVVMELIEAANETGGNYDGWETQVLRGTSEEPGGPASP